MKINFLVLILASLFTCFAAERSWKTLDGKSFEGEYISANEKQVSILVKGKERKVKLETLSDEDKEFVAEYAKKQRKEGSVFQNHNFDEKWPNTTMMEDKLKAKLIKKDGEHYVYETTHFRFYTTVKLSLDTISIIGRVFEGTYTACKNMPLNFPCRRYEACVEIEEGSDEDEAKAEFAGKEEEKLVARLFETKELYLKHIGADWENSAGLFDGKEVLVPFSSLGIVKKGSKYSFESKRDMDVGTLIHEITHQMTCYSGDSNSGMQKFTKEEIEEFQKTGKRPEAPFSPDQMPIWFIEGVAEFVGNAPYKNGRFTLGKVESTFAPFVVGGPGVAGSRNLGRRPQLPRLQEFMNMSRKTFQSADMEQAQINYAYSAMIFYYFARLDGKGDAARFKRWMQGIQNGQAKATDYERLLDGRSWDKLEKDFAKGMKSKLGVTVDWQ